MNCSIALQYYDSGLLPIPLEDKRSLVKWGDFTTKRPDRQTVENWFSKFNTARIGLITGMVSDTLVLDEDGEEGRKSLEGHEIPKTWQVKTPRGGHHYYFSFPKVLKVTPYKCLTCGKMLSTNECEKEHIVTRIKTTLASLLPKVDVRGNAGYVVSVNGHEDYKWIHSPYDTDLAETPQWLISLLLNKDRSPKAIAKPEQSHWLSDILGGVGKGQRHEALVKLASYYFSRMPSDVAIQLLHDWNEKNDPPIESTEIESQITDLKNRFKQGSYKSTFNEQATPEDEEVMSMTEIRQNVKMPEWINNPYIPEGGLILLCGEGGVGKTWVGLDLAYELTLGGKWLGYFPLRKSKVIYVDEERTKTFFKLRFNKMEKAKGYPMNEKNFRLSVGKFIKLDQDRGIKILNKIIEKQRPDVVIIDAFADCMTGNENNAIDILKIYDVFKSLRDRFNVTFVIIDHEKQALLDRTGKIVLNVENLGNDVRGNKAKRNACDIQLSCKRVDGSLKIFHSKSNWTKKARTFIVGIDDLTDEAISVTFKGFV